MNRSQPSWWPLISLGVLAIVVRGSALLMMNENLRDDPDAYRSIAQNLMIAGTFGFLQEDGEPGGPTAYRPPLYPLVLSFTVVKSRVNELAVAGLHLILGVATVLLTYQLARRWGLRHWSFLAATLVVFDPILVSWSTFVMTETLATLLVVVGLFALTRYDDRPTLTSAVIAGGALALAVLCRPTFLIWQASVTLIVLVTCLRRRRPLDVAAMILASVVLMLPWTIRNWRIFRQPVLATTHGGYTLLLGNNRHFYEYLREADWQDVWNAESFHEEWKQRRAGCDEVAADRLAYRLAFTEIAREPGMFVQACLVRVARLWRLVPLRTDQQSSRSWIPVRVLVGSWYLIVLLLALISLMSMRDKLWATPWLWGVLLLLTTTGVHAFYWSNMRMRAPLVPLVCMLAAAGMQAIFMRKGRRKSFE